MAQAATNLSYVDQRQPEVVALAINVQPPHLRMDHVDGMWMLYDSKADALFAVDPQQQTYTRMDRAMVAQLAVAMDMIEEQLKGLPPEQRAAAEKMMGRSGKATTDKMQYVETEKTRQHLSAECRVVHLVRNNELRHEICVAKHEALKVPSADFSVVTKMFRLMYELRESVGHLFPQDIPDPSKIDGIVVESNGFKTGHQLLKEVTFKPLDADKFKIPDNYQQTVVPNFIP